MNKLQKLSFLVFLAAVGAPHVMTAESLRAPLKVGDQAPDFSAPLTDGTTFQLSKWLVKAPLILYFYPKDDTPGCTKEACGLRDDFSQFRNLRATVIGVSYDSIASHKKFIAKYNLPFLLIADEKKTVAKAFGVDGALFAKRATFIIDEKGKIVYANPYVDPQTNSKEVQGALSDWFKVKPVDMSTDPNHRDKHP